MQAKRILVTGGPVHAHLDAVKIITNRFKGGLMADLADMLSRAGNHVTYLTAKGMQLPPGAAIGQVTVLYHNGFQDYMDMVLRLSPDHDAVVLGAAVANLIPLEPWTGKFPSHNYKPGDRIEIPFTIAPRVVDQVKKVAPNAQLFAFKLLDNVPHETLIDAAYDIVLESKATCVFANDTNDLKAKYAVTKERGVHPMSHEDVASLIIELLHDAYYKTVHFAGLEDLHRLPEYRDSYEVIIRYIERFRDKFERTYGKAGYRFGTVAVKADRQTFLTTGRGKREMDQLVLVHSVDHDKREVRVFGPDKATLNAPLLATLFERPEVHAIVHYHELAEGVPTYPYAPPGTVRDSSRGHGSAFFNIAGHGCFRLFDRDGNQLTFA